MVKENTLDIFRWENREGDANARVVRRNTNYKGGSRGEGTESGKFHILPQSKDPHGTVWYLVTKYLKKSRIKTHGMGPHARVGTGRERFEVVGRLECGVVQTNLEDKRVVNSNPTIVEHCQEQAGTARP